MWNTSSSPSMHSTFKSLFTRWSCYLVHDALAHNSSDLHLCIILRSWLYTVMYVVLSLKHDFVTFLVHVYFWMKSFQLVVTFVSDAIGLFLWTLFVLSWIGQLPPPPPRLFPLFLSPTLCLPFSPFYSHSLSFFCPLQFSYNPTMLLIP